MRAIPDLEVGDRVTLTYDRDSIGEVVRLGPEVSEVRWDDKRKQFISNRHLEKVKK